MYIIYYDGVFRVCYCFAWWTSSFSWWHVVTLSTGFVSRPIRWHSWECLREDVLDWDFSNRKEEPSNKQLEPLHNERGVLTQLPCCDRRWLIQLIYLEVHSFCFLIGLSIVFWRNPWIRLREGKCWWGHVQVLCHVSLVGRGQHIGWDGCQLESCSIGSLFLLDWCCVKKVLLFVGFGGWFYCLVLFLVGLLVLSIDGHFLVYLSFGKSMLGYSLWLLWKSGMTAKVSLLFLNSLNIQRTFPFVRKPLQLSCIVRRYVLLILGIHLYHLVNMSSFSWGCLPIGLDILCISLLVATLLFFVLGNGCSI